MPINPSLAASVTAPSGNILDILSTFFNIFLAALFKSVLFKLALASVTFLTGTSNISAVVSGDKSPNFLNDRFLAGMVFILPCILFIACSGFLLLLTSSSATAYSLKSCVCSAPPLLKVRAYFGPAFR